MKWTDLLYLHFILNFYQEESHGYKQELVNGYETEIKYQRHMLENLGRWFSLLFIIASIGVVLIYLFHKSFLPLLILGILLALVGILGMIVFGYGIYRGRINLQKVIDDFNQKLYNFKFDILETSHLFLRCFFLTISDQVIQ